MSTTSRSGGASLAVRLLALVVVPLVALSILAVRQIRREHRLADHEAAIAERVDLQRTVAKVYAPAQVERMALEGLARIDELGVPRAVAVAVAGIDLEAEYDANARELDTALDELVLNHRALELPDGDVLGDRLGPIRGALDTQRALSADLRTTPGDVARVFDDLSALLDDALDSGRATNPDGPSTVHAELDALARVVSSAGVSGERLIQGILYRTDELRDETLVAFAAHRAHLEAYRSMIGADDGARLDDLVALLDEVELPAAVTADSAATTDPEVIRASAIETLDHFAYLEALDAYSDAVHGEVAAAAADAAADAGASADRTEALLVVVAATSLALMLGVLWSVVAPIRRLTTRAEAIGNGELDGEPLTPRGPSDVRALTATMNEMQETLRRIKDEIERLALGSIQPGTETSLPGAIGVAMRGSVERLAHVTELLQRSEQLSSAIVAEAADAIWTTDEAGIIRSANRASADLTAIEPEDQIGRSIHDLVSRTSGQAKMLVNTGDGDTVVLVATSDILVGDTRLAVVIAHDISERTRFEDRLSYQAHHDALTGLPNRFAVLEHLDELIARGVDVAVLFVDLDAFKAINDTQGHAAGDRVLAEVGVTLQHCVRHGEFVGRLGGDEFVVVAQRFAQPADVMALGQRIIREIEQPRAFADQLFALSASVGVAIATPGTPALDLIRQADNALYQAKRLGRGRVGLFDASVQEQVERESELELALRQAVRNNELLIHLQPVVELDTGTVTGAEALVRWERPGHGMVPPGDFIPIAERSSLIFDIERWVLSKACERVVGWRRRRPDCDHRIAVNISGRHLIDGDLLADVDAALALTGADPSMLELELTETQLLEDLDRASEVLDVLRARGINIAVDDFGTGYSSMTYLQSLPIDAVKIDRSFVARATEHGYDSTFIEALLTIGRTLDLNVVAEGVETDEQLDYVRARGCDRAQGFFLARPMPVEEAEELMFGTLDEPAAVRPPSPG